MLIDSAIMSVLFHVAEGVVSACREQWAHLNELPVGQVSGGVR